MSAAAEQLDAIEALEAALGAVATVIEGGAWQLTGEDVVDLTRRCHVMMGRLQAIGLALVQEVCTRGLYNTTASITPRAFLSQTLMISARAAGEQVRMAQALHERYPDTRAALAGGGIGYEQAKGSVAVLDGLPEATTPEQREWAEGLILAHAPVLNGEDIRKLHKKLDEAIDPDGVELREETAKRKRGLHVKDNGDGTQRFTWIETEENAALVKAAYESLAAPQPATGGERDPRSAAVRRADAMLDLCKQTLRFGDLPVSRGQRPHLHVTFTAATLRKQPGHPFGRAATGENLSAEAIRRLACDADLYAILLNDDGVPLNVGRGHRSVTPGQWMALVARDVGCVFPSCTRPAAWTQAHHLWHWGDLGPTDLDNLALLCDPHHDAVHHQGWEIFLGTDRKPRLRPPERLDPQRTPLINLHWRAQQALRDIGHAPSTPDTTSWTVARC